MSVLRPTGREDARAGADVLVAGGVTEGVVDDLEVVQVDRQQRPAAAVALHERQLMGELAAKAAPVVQARQRIVVGEILKLPLDLLASDDVLQLTNGVQRAPIVVERKRGGHEDPDRVPSACV
jgi:hypothetical protein